MRIAHVLRRLSFSDWGGTEQVVWNLAKAQKAAGHEVRLFATTALCPVAREEREGLEILRFAPVYPWWPMPRRLVAELDRKGGNPFVPGLGRALRAWRPDVVHCHAMARIAELCLRTAAAIGAKSVVSLHGGGALVPGAEAASLKAPTRGRLPWGKALDLAMGWTRRVPEDFGGIVCVGEDEADYWKRRHPRVLFLPNGVDCSLFAPAASAAPAVAGGSGGGEPPGRCPLFRILCVARIDRQKNQLALVEWLGRHPGAEVRLVGPVTQPDYLAEIRARAEALGVSGRLSVAGALPPGSPELAAEYRAAAAFVLPSRHEPFGIAVLEAWAAGVPVAAARVGGLARLCEANPGAAVTFDPADPASLDAALGRILSPDFPRERALAAAAAAAAEYDWGRIAGRLVDFYGGL